MKVKVTRWLAMGFVVVTSSVHAQKEEALEDRFDALAKSIAPVLALLTPAGSNGNHAIDLQASLTEASGLPGQPIGAPVRISLQFPDKLLVQFPTPSGSATICRDGQTVWAFPATQFSPLVEKVGARVSTTPLPPFQIDEKKAILLPALFDVHDEGLVRVGDQNYRVLDVRLAPAIKEKRETGWPVRLWINPSDHRVAQVALRSKEWNATLTIQKLELSPTLPPSTWQPAPEQHDQVTAVPGEKIRALLQLALKQKK